MKIKHKMLHKSVLIFSLITIITLLSDFARTESFYVKRVIDGDTLLLSNGKRVRLIGVDTPEYHRSKKLHRDARRSGRDIETLRFLEKKATGFTKKMVQGKKVRLEFDQANAHNNYEDRYGRILAYVFLRDGTFLNAEILIQGYGHAYTQFPFKYMQKFRTYYRDAKNAKRGLWEKDV